VRKFYNGGETKMFNLASTNIGVKDSDYDYIETFINYLREIIEIIVNLFKGLGSSSTTETTTAAATEKTEG
jgi:hypothetical protein